MERETTVVIIGGGATGTGILRDLAMRGIKAMLFEQGGLCHGTSSRFHGLLHSGGRYVVSDNEAAAECIRENTILRSIGRQCIDQTEGFFVLTEEDDPDYVDKWVEGCRKAGITATELEPAQALRLEPALNPRLKRVFQVPDAAVDGFRLVLHNAMSAERHGASFHTYHKVLNILSSNGRVTGVEVLNTKSGNRFEVACQYVVNAAGPWSGLVAGLAGLHVPVTPDKGTLIVFNHRITSHVVNRLHKSSDGDIFVPNGSVTILGTTSKTVENPADTSSSTEESLRLLDLGRPLFPGIDNFRILRAFAGTRPLYTPGSAAGRSATRGFHITDHGEEGLEGLVTIFGGKLTTYRLMAEKLADLVAAKLGVTTPCRTAEEPLVLAPKEAERETAKRLFAGASLPLVEDRLGDDFGSCVARSLRFADGHNPLVCECEMVSLAELAHVASLPSTHSLHDVRLRTRLGMGTCQGTFCGLRAASILAEQGVHLANEPLEDIHQFVTERWKGTRTVFWGQLAREMEFARMLHAGSMGRYARLVEGTRETAKLPGKDAKGLLGVRKQADAAAAAPTSSSSRRSADVLVVGSGLAGLFAAWTAARKGARVTLLSRGAGSLHIAQGSIDVLGRTAKGEVDAPLAHITKLPKYHPYRILGRSKVDQALESFRELCLEAGVEIGGQKVDGEWHNAALPTAIGTRKLACLYPQSQDPAPLLRAKKIVICGIEGLRDCLPHLAQFNLQTIRDFSDKTISCAWLPDPGLGGSRSRTVLDVARSLEKGEHLAFFHALSRAARNADAILLPPVAGTRPGLGLWRKLCAVAGCPVVEMASLPPAVIGLRLGRLIDDTLAKLGVTILENVRVTGSEMDGNRLTALVTSHEDGVRKYVADHYILATGGLVSGGLVLESGRAVEPVLGLELPLPTETIGMTADDPLAAQPYAALGVPVLPSLEPTLDGKTPLAVNVRFAGRSLAHYDPAFEGSGNGVALASACWAASEPWLA